MARIEPGGARFPPPPGLARTGALAEMMALWDVPDDAPIPAIFAALAWHPDVLARWDAMQRSILLRGVLPPRDRELLILRTAVHCRATYIWQAHADRHGPAAGLTSTEIARVTTGPSAPGWDRSEIAVLTAADELHARSELEAATWEALRDRYDEQQLIEVPLVVGEYHLMAYVLGALGIRTESG